jgi:hypothetical protein
MKSCISVSFLNRFSSALAETFQGLPKIPAVTEEERQRVRLRDVAERAGVSVGSASQAFGRPELVSEKVRERVLTPVPTRPRGTFEPDGPARSG